MKFVAILVLGSISLLLPTSAYGFRNQRATTRLGVWQRTLSHDSTSAVNAIDESRAGSSVLADAGAAQSDAEDPIDDDVQSAGSFSPLLDSPRVDLTARARSFRFSVHILDRSLPIRC